MTNETVDQLHTAICAITTCTYLGFLLSAAVVGLTWPIWIWWI